MNDIAGNAMDALGGERMVVKWFPLNPEYPPVIALFRSLPWSERVKAIAGIIAFAIVSLVIVEGIDGVARLFR
jgi:hypothetical protein